MTHFDHLRTTPWEPRFEWVATQYEAADLINRPHEDYPKRCQATESVIEHVTNLFADFDMQYYPNNIYLEFHHRVMFRDESFGGHFRTVNVTVGPHRPPEHEQVAGLMNELYAAYGRKLKTTDDLIDWYTDYETIHPFQDGNGRVGGVIVSSLSHQMHPEKGWLAPLQ